MGVDGVQRMTSLEIAELAGKQHKMEPAWEKTCGRKFALTSRTVIQPNGGQRQEPCYQLTKAECLYIATKFNDEARARLVLRWEACNDNQARNEQRGSILLSKGQFCGYLLARKEQV